MRLADTIEPTPEDSRDLARLVKDTFENLEPSGLHRLADLYASDVSFEDPIHGIQGLDALIGYFEKLFTNVEQCRFKFHRSVVGSDGMFFSWTMMIRHRSIKQGELIRVEGASYLKHRNGKIYYHRDYFDLGAMVYENVPGLGLLIRYIRSRMAR